MMIDFSTHPEKYTHWHLTLEGDIAWLTMDVDESRGLFPGYDLKMNSYDIGVDIELYDAIQRLRFEHPEVGAVVPRSAKERVFCSGANIRMLGGAAHGNRPAAQFRVVALLDTGIERIHIDMDDFSHNVKTKTIMK